jgi:hypothetical protein
MQENCARACSRSLQVGIETMKKSMHPLDVPVASTSHNPQSSETTRLSFEAPVLDKRNVRHVHSILEFEARWIVADLPELLVRTEQA